MKPRRALLSAVLLALFPFGSTLLADDIAENRMQVIDAWAVTTLGSDDSRVFRAFNGSDYSDAYLAVNYRAGVCDLPDLEMRVTLEERQRTTEVVNLAPTDIRIDRLQPHGARAELSTRADDDGFYARFYVEDQAQLLREMRRGDMMRLRLSGEEGHHWHMEFRLYGADQALPLAADECRRTTQRPQDFFESMP